MRIGIEVKNRKEGEAIRRALEDVQVRAFVNVVGTLMTLPSDRSRERMLRFIDDQFDEADANYISVFDGR